MLSILYTCSIRYTPPHSQTVCGLQRNVSFAKKTGCKYCFPRLWPRVELLGTVLLYSVESSQRDSARPWAGSGQAASLSIAATGRDEIVLIWELCRPGVGQPNPQR